MHIEHIESRNDFVYFGRYHMRRADVSGQVWEHHFPRGLVEIELYLRSLYAVIQAHQNNRMSWQLIATLLQQAYATEPAEYNPAWAAYRKPPEPKYSRPVVNIMGVVVHEALLRGVVPFYDALKSMVQPPAPEIPALDTAVQTLAGQIADLHWIVETWSTDEAAARRHMMYAWQNPMLNQFIDCGLSYIHGLRLEKPRLCDWDILRLFLQAGQSYE